MDMVTRDPERAMGRAAWLAALVPGRDCVAVLEGRPPGSATEDVTLYVVQCAKRPVREGYRLYATVRKRPWKPGRLDEVRRLAEAIDVDVDPKDVRRGMLTQEERDLYALLPPSTVRWLLDAAGVPK